MVYENNDYNNCSNIKSKNIDTYPNKELSPASKINLFIPSFSNLKRLYIHDDSYYLTTSCPGVLGEYFNISIRIKKATKGYLVVGVSDKIFNIKNAYLGGDLGKGNWGISDNSSLGEEGTWKKGNSYKTGDIVTLIGNKGIISYTVNHQNNEYTYDMKTTELYLSFSFYQKDDSVEILDI